MTIGDIDPDEPAKKVERFQPLADYLAKRLGDLGIGRGSVLVARNIEEMAGFLKDGTVDIYFDSVYPAQAVRELSSSQFLLRRWKESAPTYWSVYVARRDSGIASVEDLKGKVIAFEEPHSTTGYLLPAATLIQRGLGLRQVAGPEAAVGLDETGYIFSRDEENSVELILQGRVAAAGMSNQDYEELPPELIDRMVVLDRTMELPRQIVSSRPGLDKAVVSRIRELLVALDQTDEGRRILRGMKDSQFDPLPPDLEVTVGKLRELMGLVAGN